MSKPTNKLTKEALQRCADCGMTKSQAARELGVTLSTIWGAARRFDISFPNHFDLVDRAAMYRRCAEAGMTRSEAARELGVSSKTVSQAAIRYGVKFVSESERCRAQWASCAKAGMTLAEAAEAMGKTKDAAADAAKRYQIKFKDQRKMSRSARTAKAARIARNAMGAFWRIGRNCAVPLTFDEFRMGLSNKQRVHASDILEACLREGWLEKSSAVGRLIYAPTASGAEMARAARSPRAPDRRAA